MVTARIRACGKTCVRRGSRSHCSCIRAPSRMPETLMVLDPTAGQNMNQIFLEDLQHAEEITLEPFRKRSWLQRLAEWGANSLTRLL